MNIKNWAKLAVFAGILFLVLTTPPLLRFAPWQTFNGNPENFSTTLNEEDVNAFLELWPEYLKTDAAQYGLQKVSLASGSPSESFSPQLRHWFEGKGWNIDRFFYIEDRLKAIIKTNLLLENIKSNKVIAAKSKNAELQAIIAEQERQINAEKISQDELDMIRPVIYKVNKILETGKAD